MPDLRAGHPGASSSSVIAAIPTRPHSPQQLCCSPDIGWRIKATHSFELELETTGARVPPTRLNRLRCVGFVVVPHRPSPQLSGTGIPCSEGPFGASLLTIALSFTALNRPSASNLT
ncbi:hypothetical protein NMY22_g18553 [Coprinellus aureogranulatus]|nr:hypothetical protein NMY22_g18553 [Coprinellus aureogranulatus]